MGVFAEAEARLYRNVYICRKCERKTRVPIGKVLSGGAYCTRCKCKDMRSVRKKNKK